VKALFDGAEIVLLHKGSAKLATVVRAEFPSFNTRSLTLAIGQQQPGSKAPTFRSIWQEFEQGKTHVNAY